MAYYTFPKGEDFFPDDIMQFYFFQKITNT